MAASCLLLGEQETKIIQEKVFVQPLLLLSSSARMGTNKFYNPMHETFSRAFRAAAERDTREANCRKRALRLYHHESGKVKNA